jgi:hypothetical protein
MDCAITANRVMFGVHLI